MESQKCVCGRTGTGGRVRSESWGGQGVRLYQSTVHCADLCDRMESQR